MTKGLRIFLDNDANIPGRIALVLLRDHPRVPGCVPRVFRWLPLRVPRVFRWLPLCVARVAGCRWLARVFWRVAGVPLGVARVKS